MNIIIPLEDELYQDYINRILCARENIKDPQTYQELHHIVPRCMNGSNEQDNLIYLYAQEHYYAHKLLSQENPNNKQLQHAWIMMCFKTGSNYMNRDYVVTADEYALAKETNAILASQRFKGIKQSEDWIIKRTSKTSGEGNGMYGRKGELSPSYGIHNFGEKNPFYHHSHTEETKRILSLNHKEKYDGYKNPSAIAVVCIDTQEVFLTAQEAAKYANIEPSGSNICKCCKGKLNSSGKHPITGQRLHWRYATEEEKQNKK